MRVMLYHFFSVGAALLLAFLASVTQHAGNFQTSPQAAVIPQVQEVTLAQPTAPTPLETVVGDIVRSASSTPTKPVVPTPVVPIRPVVGPLTPQTPTLPPLTVPSVPATTTPAAPVVPSVDSNLSDEALLKAAVVNIICLQKGGLSGISGSGVIVDPRGIIMTVAHVGQNFLLRDYPEEDSGTCYIRTGSPAKNAYSADLVFVSPSWIEENSDAFLSANPKGTGENDFAFLAITGSVTGTPLPSVFPYIPLAPANTNIKKGDRVGTGSYAAEFLTSSQVRSSLYPTIKFANVESVFTFDNGTDDLFSVAAGSAAQEGSSGGAVINEDDRLIGVISTRTVKPDLALRTMQAVTIDHARRSFRDDMGENMDSYLKSSPAALIAKFKPKAVGLLDILQEEIACAPSNAC